MTRALYAAWLGTALTLAAWGLAGHPLAGGSAIVAALAWVALERRAPPVRFALPAWLAPLVLVVVVAAVCWPTLHGDFLGDDFGYVGLFHRKSLASFVRLGDISEGIWGKGLDELRPVFAFSYKLSLLLHGMSAAGFHAVNLGVHLLACLLVYALVRTLEPADPLPALAAALLFGLMPVHVEPIAWITGKVDSLPTVFYLLVLWQWMRFRRTRSQPAYAFALATFALGLFTKEILITLPATLVAFDLLLARHVTSSRERLGARAFLAHVPFVALTAGFLAARHQLFDTFAREGRGMSSTRLEQFARAQPQKLAWLLTPFERWDRVESLLAGLILGTLAAAAFWLWRRRAQHERTVAAVAFFGLAFYASTLAPLAVTYASARHLYLPSVGVAIAMALLLVPPAHGGQTRASVLRFATLLLLLGTFTHELRRDETQWIAAGDISRAARTQVGAALRDVAPGTTVVVAGVPGALGDVVVWKFALPFALQPPFVAADTYTPYRVLEPPDLYCCPFDQWWRAKRPILAALVDGDPEATVDVTLLRWNARRGKIVVRQGRPARGFLHAQLTRALGTPFGEAEAIDGGQAQRVMSTLEDVVRLSAAHAPEDPEE